MYDVNAVLEKVLRTENVCPRHPLAVVIEASDFGYVTGWNGSDSCIIDGKCKHNEVIGQGIEVMCHVVHAEARAIARAAKDGMRLLDATLYLSSWFPCAGCAEAIVEAGIKRIVTPDEVYFYPGQIIRNIIPQDNLILVPSLRGSKIYNFERAERTLRERGVQIQVNPEIRPDKVIL
jgi:deoxycytidylate deaminase